MIGGVKFASNEYRFEKRRKSLDGHIVRDRIGKFRGMIDGGGTVKKCFKSPVMVNSE